MRLIHTTNLNFKWFTWKNIPDYAILSHTWGSDKQTGESTEVTFRDMTDIMKDPTHPSSKKAGYRKIVSACKVARDNKLEYIWVDTCCIEKESSSELSEAINSMYRWYQNAKVCYAYLSDLKAVDNIKLALPECRWFTRGWCLQELIAPSEVWFYDSNWDYVGSKEGLSQLLFDITQINKEVLRDSNLVTSVPVARRMSWAAKRETSREEDLAYCLLGIFGVNMPMLYGEGPNAFLRLQEQIVLSSNDLSIFAFDLNLKSINPSGRIVMSYCDMFAKSPDAFKNHGAREYPETEPHWNEAFTVTNRGIYFQLARLHPDMRNGVYRMSLNTEYPSLNHGFIYLRKVGPRLFVRCTFVEPDRHSDGSELLSTQVEEEMYIIKHITPSRLQQLMDVDKYSIQVTSETHILTPTALEVLDGFPCYRHWDESRMKHLARGEKNFRGCWKLYPYFAPTLGTARRASQGSPYFVYLACGLLYSENLLHPKPWVRLYYPGEWEDAEQKLKSVSRLHDVGGNDFAGLGYPPHSFDPTIITAHIELKEGSVPQFVLRINMRER
ncbi:HET domain-containing protein [Rutstroemia sp. NJR-2017a BVV2]|nr:HET domain-containing protein [Rutstroemia sp. NJR-2017a BVV2]